MMFLVRGPVENIVASDARGSAHPMLVVFSLVALASSATGGAPAPSPPTPSSRFAAHGVVGDRKFEFIHAKKNKSE